MEPFIKYVNYNLTMPTRRQVAAEVEPATFAADLQMDSADGRIVTNKYVSKSLQEKFAGVAQAPLKVTKGMSKENITKRQRVKHFVK